MRLTNASGVPATWTLGFQRDGRELLVVVAKATYRIPPDGGVAEPADAHVPLTEADEFTGEPGLSAPRYETDFAHGKPGCDVLLHGSAHAPAGHSATRIDVGLKVGVLVKRFSVVGHRHWHKRLVGISASAPEPFAVLPFSYDVAFGGTDRSEQAEGRTAAYLRNPVGRGYATGADIDGQPLPNTEEIGRPVESPTAPYMPQALGPIGRNWLPRMRYAGTYDARWIENDAPFWPADFDERYFHAAPPDQVIPHPRGGEEVVLKHLTPDGLRRFHLPAHGMPVTFIPVRGSDVVKPARLDTLLFEPDLGRFTMTWRALLPLPRSIFDVDEVVVGEMSAAWHRARRFPEKTYYAGLGALVRDRRRAS